MKELLTFKYSDELGYCYREVTQEVTTRQKNKIIRDFLAGSINTCGKMHVDDIFIVRKSSGEELWIYAEEQSGFRED